MARDCRHLELRLKDRDPWGCSISERRTHVGEGGGSIPMQHALSFAKSKDHGLLHVGFRPIRSAMVDNRLPLLQRQPRLW
jgi:hypothetical protein